VIRVQNVQTVQIVQAVSEVQWIKAVNVLNCLNDLPSINSGPDTFGKLSVTLSPSMGELAEGNDLNQADEGGFDVN